MHTGQTVTHAIVCKQRLLLHGKGCLCLTLGNDVVRVHILLLLMWLVSHSQSDLGDAGQNLRKHTCSTLVLNISTASMGSALALGAQKLM